MNFMKYSKEQTLSARECQVLDLIAHGYKTREIAALLNIEECTV
jgi:DNA-binding NarL/FixJ family response regulator